MAEITTLGLIIVIALGLTGILDIILRIAYPLDGQR